MAKLLKKERSLRVLLQVTFLISYFPISRKALVINQSFNLQYKTEMVNKKSFGEKTNQQGGSRQKKSGAIFSYFRKKVSGKSDEQVINWCCLNKQVSTIYE